MSRWKLNKKQVINFTWNLDNLTLDWCDLDQEYNILEAPECDCGCGEKAKLCLYDDEDVKDFCKGMAEDNDCDHCTVFAINEENYLIATIRDEDDIYVVQTKEPIFYNCFESLQGASYMVRREITKRGICFFR